MKIPVIVGPTASGKTDLSIKLAKKINGEIISVDSMQIYKGMDIGTAKITKEEMQGIPHHMLSIKEIYERFSVAEYVKEVNKIIKDIINRKKHPIIIGGTGLYVNALCFGYNFEENDEEKLLEFREDLERKLEKGETSLDKLYEKAYEIDKEACLNISKNDKKRILRILEINYLSKDKKTNIDKKRKTKQEFDFTLFYIDIEREKLYERINKRVDIMLQKGLIDEVKNAMDILDKYEKKQANYREYTAIQAIGYKETVEYINGNIGKEEYIEKLKRDTRRYAKRQITWFKKNEKIILDRNLDDEKLLEIICKNI